MCLVVRFHQLDFVLEGLALRQALAVRQCVVLMSNFFAIERHVAVEQLVFRILITVDFRCAAYLGVGIAWHEIIQISYSESKRRSWTLRITLYLTQPHWRLVKLLKLKNWSENCVAVKNCFQLTWGTPARNYIWCTAWKISISFRLRRNNFVLK